MSKKVTTLAIALVLLLVAFAPLVLAQQSPETDQSMGEATPNQDQPAGGTQSSLPTLENPYVLDANGNIEIDCGAVFSNLVQLEMVADQLQNDPQFQSELQQAQNLAQLCMNGGFSPTATNPNSTGFEQYQGDRAAEPLA